MAKLIMVFNDTQEILLLFEAILTEEDYEVKLNSYNNLELELIKELKPDLVISDIPPVSGKEKQGWQLAQMLRMTRETENIPMVLCTTDVKLAEESEGHLAAKGMTVVTKPFNIADLIKAVEALIGKANAPELGPLHPLSKIGKETGNQTTLLTKE